MLTIKKPDGQLQYLEYVDPTATNCPVLIFLHGHGERGTDINLLYKNGLPKLLKAQSETFLKGFTVICPQLPITLGNGWTSSTTDPVLIKFINYIRATYPGDNRYFVTGLSMGGGGAWEATYNSFSTAGMVTAIVPVSTTGDYKKAKITGERQVPVWVICGDSDNTYTLTDAKRPILGMKTFGPISPEPLFTAIVGGGHNALTWDVAYSTTPRAELGNTTIYEWMLKQGTPVVIAPSRVNIVKIEKETLTGKIIFTDENGEETIL